MLLPDASPRLEEAIAKRQFMMAWEACNYNLSPPKTDNRGGSAGMLRSPSGGARDGKLFFDRLILLSGSCKMMRFCYEIDSIVPLVCSHPC